MSVPADFDPHAFLLSLFEAARKAADPAACVPAHLPPPPKGRTIVVGAGRRAMGRVYREGLSPDEAAAQGVKKAHAEKRALAGV